MKNAPTQRSGRLLTLRARLSRRVTVAACALLAITACDVHKVSEPGSLSTLVVTPGAQTLAINGTQQFTAIGKDFAGVAVPVTPTWSVVAGGGSISPTGMFTAGTTTGTFVSTVKATSGSLSATASVTVTVGSLATITITPSPDTTVVNGTKQFVAVGRDAGGNVVGITPVWSVANGGGTINSATGLFTAGAVAGTFANTIRVTSGSISSTVSETVVSGALATIVVTPNPVTLGIGTNQQFLASGADAFGNPVSLGSVAWSVANCGGTIGSASGLFTAGNTVGIFANTVRATSGGISGTAFVTVTAGPLATIIIVPATASLTIGSGQQFIAEGRDASGNFVAIVPTWTVVNGGGTINAATGVFTAGTTAGTFTNTVRAASGFLSATATVTVVGGPIATIVVTPNPAAVGIGGVQQFVATGRDALGNVVTIVPTWSVVNGGGTIGATSGVFTAGTVAGNFANTVRATSGAITGSATVDVLAGALATITVTPTTATLGIGAAQQFVATGRDASGNVVSITPVWSVVNGGGTIGVGSGLFTAGSTTGTYTNTVRATSGAIFGSASVTVVAGPLATIEVSPVVTTLRTGMAQQFIATGRDAAGNVVPITPTWSVVANGGTIGSSSGLFTAGSMFGTYTNTVRATSGAIFGSASVIVAVGPLETITVTPNPDTTVVGGNKQFTAVGRDGSGNIVGISPTWAVVNGGGSINSGSGLFTAGGIAGTYTNTISASFGGIVGFATEIVTAVPPPVLASITISPNPASLLVNATQQFVATGRDAMGNIMPISPLWTVVNGGGSINLLSGLFTAGSTPGTFTNTVRVASGGISSTATVIVTAAVVPPFLSLGAAAPNGIMAGTAVTCVTGGTVNADVSISPGNTLTGFGPCVITGVQNLGNAIAAQAQIDLTTAYNTLAGLPCPPANAIVANLGGTTKAAGVYCSATGVGVTGTLTLDGGGNPNAVFVFQVGTALTTAGDVVLINGAQAKNVYWQVGSSATIGTASQFQGNILALTSITLVDNATLRGRALARNGAVTLGTNNTITLP